jgi:hypothetical protein
VKPLWIGVLCSLLFQPDPAIVQSATIRLSRSLGGEYNVSAKLVTQEKHVMERELVDRAEAIQQRILQLRDSL